MSPADPPVWTVTRMLLPAATPLKVTVKSSDELATLLRVRAPITLTKLAAWRGAVRKINNAAPSARFETTEPNLWVPTVASLSSAGEMEVPSCDASERSAPSTLVWCARSPNRVGIAPTCPVAHGDRSHTADAQKKKGAARRRRLEFRRTD